MKKDEMAGYVPMLKCEFIGRCHAIGIHGGRKYTYYEALCMAALSGNERAKELLSNIKRIEL